MGVKSKRVPAEIPVPELSPLDVAFPAHVLEWVPPMTEIPDEFKNLNRGTEWNEIASGWFFNGLPANVEFHPRPGIDGEAAFNALRALLGSFEPKHEHKEAAAAYLMFCWFEKIKNWRKA